MTSVREETVTVPVQPGPVEPPAREPGHDHVRSHPLSCYWDMAGCRWVCTGA